MMFSLHCVSRVANVWNRLKKNDVHVSQSGPQPSDTLVTYISYCTSPTILAFQLEKVEIMRLCSLVDYCAFIHYGKPLKSNAAASLSLSLPIERL